MSVAVVGLLFASCEDTKKKEAEERAAAEQIRMDRERDSLLKVEEMNAARAAEMEANSIVAKAMGNSELSTLVSTLKAADLADTFKSEGQYTVFAPTNEAFTNAPQSIIGNLMEPDNKDQLQDFLKYHVLQGKLPAADVLAKVKEANNKLDVTTLNGDILTISETNGKLMIKDSKGKTATVSSADIDASNGTVHVIDKVLMPSM
ncbi:MAG: fasciclin [Aequorivita sp.]|nr:fasciclin [Aequorivita sp.]|tara:strand:- start:21393 stop:22004 length:612 start_codon:yes stop_codon:yes gene_type:complete